MNTYHKQSQIQQTNYNTSRASSACCYLCRTLPRDIAGRGVYKFWKGSCPRLRRNPNWAAPGRFRRDGVGVFSQCRPAEGATRCRSANRMAVAMAAPSCISPAECLYKSRVQWLLHSLGMAGQIGGMSKTEMPVHGRTSAASCTRQKCTIHKDKRKGRLKDWNANTHYTVRQVHQMY